jgi:hypothetical protein
MGRNRSSCEHDGIVKQLEDMVRSNYSITMTCVDVRDPQTGRLVGEIDLVGIVGNNWDLYEVKTNDQYVKAESQLRRLRRYLCDCANVRLYYYSGKRRKIEEVG